jgi:hypothetical protein
MYLLIGFEKMPKVLKPGNKVKSDMIKELAEELE